MTAPEPPAGPDLPGSDLAGSELPGNDPQVVPRRLHPLSPVVAGLFFVVRAWPIALLSIARGAWVPMLAIAAALVVWQWLVWLRTSYGIGSDGLTVRSGIVWRNIQVVPPQRVQQVEVRRQLRHRATGLAVVRIGLAGGGANAQVELGALSERDAEDLASTLERWRARHRNATDAREGATATTTPEPFVTASGEVIPLPPEPLPPPARPPLLRLTAGQVVIGGLTSRSLWLAPFVALAAVVQFVNDSQFAVDSTDTMRSIVSDASPVLLLLVLLLVGLVVAAAGTVVNHYGLVVEEVDDDLVVRRGLLDRRTVTIPRDRVQYVELAAHVVRRRLHLASFGIRTADLGGGGAESESSTSIPIGDRDDLESLIPELVRNVEFPDTRRHPPAAVRRSIVRRSVRLVPIAALVGLLLAGVAAAPVGAGVGVVVAVPVGWLEGRRLKSGWTKTGIVTERGVISWRRRVVPIRRVQSVGVSQNPFQRRLGLATVRLDVAGSVGGIELLDVATADATRITELVGTPIPIP
ncbi:MAG TPA: PH domain-containing protein [Ilumatobacter sp.]|nr:PH domain-containing protein [Ilumatobacter sp.]